MLQVFIPKDAENICFTGFEGEEWSKNRIVMANEKHCFESSMDTTRRSLLNRSVA